MPSVRGHKGNYKCSPESFNPRNWGIRLVSWLLSYLVTRMLLRSSRSPSGRQSRGLCLRVWESRKADARSCEDPRGCSPLPGTNSPGLDDPSLIRIGLAKFTRIVLPKSSDSFCRGKKHNKAHQKVKKSPCPPNPCRDQKKTELASSA